MVLELLELNSIVSDSIIVDAGKTVEIDGTVTVNDYLLMSGSCTQLSTLRGSSGTGTLSSQQGT